jgi:signal transduction histidine kinase
VKFGPAGAQVAVAAREADGAIEIDVRDNGPGIPAGERECVFDRFYSADRGDRGGAGAGLGLTIAHAIATAHGGELRAIEPNGGRGAVLRLRLPLDAPPAGTGADE